MSSSINHYSLNQSKLTIISQPSQNTQSSKLFPKLCWLQTIVSKLQTQLSDLINQRQSIKKQKQLVSQTLIKKNQQAKQSLLGTIKTMQNDLLKGYERGMQQTRQVQSKVTKLKQIQVNSQKQLLGIQRRINELETQIGI